MTPYEKARKFVYQHARPLDLFRWQYHFENGSKNAVLSALEAYQNEDGGFGYAIECDCFNPNSSPIQTWAATEILREIDFTDQAHPMIKSILNYLSSGVDFDQTHRQWMNSIPSNNDYPHAIWWKYNEDALEFSYNPTACLAGFYLKYGDPKSEFYSKAMQIAREAYRFWVSHMPYSEQHVTACFIRLYEYCLEANVELFDMKEFRNKLIEQTNYELSRVEQEWDTNYVCMPSDFIKTRNCIFCSTNRELIIKECDWIIKNQLEDGSFVIPWQWWTEYKEFEVAKIWWKTEFCIKKMLFLREFKS